MVSWRWPAVLVFPVAALFFLLDLTFRVSQCSQNPCRRLVSPLLVGLIALTLMLVWRESGRRVAFEQRDQNAIDLATFMPLDQPGAPERMNGTAVDLIKETDIVPAALELNVKHNVIVHKHIVLLKVTTDIHLAWTKGIPGEGHSPSLPASGCFGWCSASRKSQMFLLPFVSIPRPSDAILMRLSFFLGRETPVPSLETRTYRVGRSGCTLL